MGLRMIRCVADWLMVTRWRSSKPGHFCQNAPDPRHKWFQRRRYSAVGGGMWVSMQLMSRRDPKIGCRVPEASLVLRDLAVRKVEAVPIRSSRSLRDTPNPYRRTTAPGLRCRAWNRSRTDQKPLHWDCDASSEQWWLNGQESVHERPSRCQGSR